MKILLIALTLVFSSSLYAAETSVLCQPEGESIACPVADENHDVVSLEVVFDDLDGCYVGSPDLVFDYVADMLKSGYWTLFVGELERYIIQDRTVLLVIAENDDHSYSYKVDPCKN